VFVDGAFLDSVAVVTLAKMPPPHGAMVGILPVKATKRGARSKSDGNVLTLRRAVRR
jgi:hypothetical protein